MKALDTNVLLRLIIDDDANQVTVGRKFAAACAKAGEKLYVNNIVLCELIWVLQTVYRYRRDETLLLLKALMQNQAYTVEAEEEVNAAIQHYENTEADFSDCLIAVKSATAGCSHCVTFDQRMHKLPQVKLL